MRNESGLQKTTKGMLKQKGQYVLAFGIVASMLVVLEYPVFVVLFFGVFAYFLSKLFSGGPRGDARPIFEFYLSAHEMLKQDEREWFGFELKETILRGESIIEKMAEAPPLVYYTLGALYNKIGNHEAAVFHLSNVIETRTVNEMAYSKPSDALRNYVRVLREIERDASDAPLTSAAIRALERSRRIRGLTLLNESRIKLKSSVVQNFVDSNNVDFLQAADGGEVNRIKPASITDNDTTNDFSDLGIVVASKKVEEKRSEDTNLFPGHKPIIEVLHDIYDEKIQ